MEGEADELEDMMAAVLLRICENRWQFGSKLYARSPLLVSVSTVLHFVTWSLIFSLAWAWRGPAAALLVMLLAWAVRRGQQDGWWTLRPGAVRETYLYCQFAALGQLAKASGRVSEADIHAVEQLMDQMKLKPEQRDFSINAFTVGRRWQEGMRHAAFPSHFQRFQSLAVRRPGMQASFLQVLVHTLLRNGRQPLAEERSVLSRLASRIGANEALIMECLAQQRSPQAQVEPMGAYAELGVAEEASVNDIKQAYRGLMRRFHPDKIAAQNLSEAERLEAEEKVRRVRAAYDELKRSRGFR
jgi:DnaJ like chaperone protein